MNIYETGEVRVHERLPEPGEAEAFEVDLPQPEDAPHAEVSGPRTDKRVDIGSGNTIDQETYDRLVADDRVDV